MLSKEKFFEIKIHIIGRSVNENDEETTIYLKSLLKKKILFKKYMCIIHLLLINKDAKYGKTKNETE